MSRRYRYVFHGGPLDGHEIEAAPRTAIYRDEAGAPLTVHAGDRRAAGGGLYEVAARPVARRPGVYRWQRPAVPATRRPPYWY